MALGQHRATHRKTPKGREDEAALTADIVVLARQYGRYGYRKIAELGGLGSTTSASSGSGGRSSG